MTIGEAQKMEAAIHKHCLACSGGSREMVDKCEIRDCALYPYRQPQRASAPKKPTAEQVSVFEAMQAVGVEAQEIQLHVW